MIFPPSESCDVLIVNWTAPANTGGGLLNYEMYVYNETYMKDIIINDTDATLNDLPANTEYTVTVVAFNELAMAKRNVTGTRRTRPEGLGNAMLL